MTLAGGIDLGGAKIEARLFDPSRGWAAVDSREIPTPSTNYGALLDALAEQHVWLEERGATQVGIGAPGLTLADGRAMTANLPSDGKPFSADLARLLGKPATIVNDCRAFAYSEALLGAGRGASPVLGLVIGTGVAGGLVSGGVLIDGPNGQAGEFGHMPLAQGTAARYGLPLLRCGCGREGCYETLCSGPGIARIAEATTGRAAAAEELAARTDPGAAETLRIWSEIVAEMLAGVVLATDPEVVVLGGGVSKMAGVAGRLARALKPRLLDGVRAPDIRPAQGGDRSGARGAALLAWNIGSEGK